jgi:hypothetical protein
MKERWYSDTENVYRGYTVNIINDEYPEDPRKAFDGMGKMVCFHKRYNLGDKHNYDPETVLQELAQEVYPRFWNFKEYWENTGYRKLVEKHERRGSLTPVLDAGREVNAKIEGVIAKIIDRKYLILELYLYDHSGLTMSTAPFSCPWDSGQIGLMVMTKEQARKEYGNDPEAEEKALKYMRGEVKEYSAYLEGDVFGWEIIDPEGDIIDSCFGYYGYDANIDWIVSEIKMVVDNRLKEEEEARQQAPARAALKTACRFKGGCP